MDRLRCSVLIALVMLLNIAACVDGEKPTTNTPKEHHGRSIDPKSILVYMGCGSYSMRISVWPLIEALTEKGHKVTFLSAHPPKVPHPNVTDFVPPKMQKWWTDMSQNLNLVEIRKKGQLVLFSYTTPLFGTATCEQLYSDPEVLPWVKQSKFDLIMIDSFANECAYGLAHVFQAKTIVLATFSVAPYFYDAYGIPDESSWIADMIFAFHPLEMSFLGRAVSAVAPVVNKFMRKYWYFPRLEEITKQGLGIDNLPSFEELERNTSLVFVTTHYAQEYARALPPNVVPIGGLVLTGNTKPLPKNIEDFINRGKNGFIYVSFGTVFEFKKLDKDVQEAFVHALLQFPDIQFIWKSAEGVGVDLPPNFLVSKWLPQQDILAHPKIKGFVSHGGLGGVNEAVYHAVPMILFPLFAEQDYNANFFEARGIGKVLEITTLKSHELQGAIQEITQDKKFKEGMKKVSSLFKDRPMSPLQTALWWTEFVLSHDAEELTEFLWPRSVTQGWMVRRQLDVWLFVGLLFGLVIALFGYILKVMVTSCIRRFTQSNKQNRSKKEN